MERKVGARLPEKRGYPGAERERERIERERGTLSG